MVVTNSAGENNNLCMCLSAYSPVHEHPATSIETILYEFVAGREVFQQVFVVNVVDFDYLVSETFELLLVQRQSEY